MRILSAVLGLLLVLAAAAGGVLWWQYNDLLDWAKTPHSVTGDVVVTVPRGMGPSAVIDQLAGAGAVDDTTRFYVYVRFVKKALPKLRSGEYAFTSGDAPTPDEVLARLMKGEELNVKVTLPEGLRVEEQAALVEAAGIGTAAEFASLARDASFVRSLGVEATSLEGYLFPDTYLVPKRTTSAAFIKLMVERFQKAWKAAEAQRAPDVTLNERQAVTLASIIEKETGQANERPRISCVFHNRLKLDMKLQTDPTVMYAAFLATGKWSDNIHRSDLDRDHPYNTYAVKGLPPGPIANAGEAALKAALRPEHCEDLFFVSRNDSTHVFCPDLTCHEANVERWQRAFFRNKGAGSDATP